MFSGRCMEIFMRNLLYHGRVEPGSSGLGEGHQAVGNYPYITMKWCTSVCPVINRWVFDEEWACTKTMLVNMFYLFKQSSFKADPACKCGGAVMGSGSTDIPDIKDPRIDIKSISIRREIIGSMSNRCRSGDLCYIWDLQDSGPAVGRIRTSGWWFNVQTNIKMYIIYISIYTIEYIWNLRYNTKAGLSAIRLLPKPEIVKRWLLKIA